VQRGGGHALKRAASVAGSQMFDGSPVFKHGIQSRVVEGDSGGELVL